MKRLASILILSAFLFTGCATTTLNPDGTTSFTEVDYASVQLLSSASVAAWAASQKDGIKKTDAEAVVKFLDIIEEFRKDGTPLSTTEWASAIKTDVPLRYQALTLVMVQLVELQLKRYGVATTIPKPGDTASKIMDAVRNGAVLALTPYLDRKA
jgi:PBP1b-binding outer membrane lipoprotein LpoB